MQNDHKYYSTVKLVNHFQTISEGLFGDSWIADECTADEVPCDQTPPDPDTCESAGEQSRAEELCLGLIEPEGAFKVCACTCMSAKLYKLHMP